MPAGNLKNHQSPDNHQSDDKNEELHSLFIKRQGIYKSSDKEVSGDSNPSFIVEEILEIVGV